MRPGAAGIVIDTSALSVARVSLYLQSLIQVHAEHERPMIVPATALVTACVGGRISAEELDPPEFTVTALSQAIVPAIAVIVTSARGPVGIDVAHAAYEASATGYPVVTADPAPYRRLAVTIDVETLPG